ncbi:MAG: SCO family protein [Gammaproteobacteria bacterium]|nr:SCO family protein [Gammaproteobacteria bacterium]
MPKRRFLTAPVLFSALLLAQGAIAAKPAEVYLAPGWGNLEFAAPEPGTYELPVVRPAAGGKLLDTKGDVVELDDLLGEKITILSFIYRTCDDVNGCPLSSMVLHRVASKLRKQPDLEDQLRLITISFDPEFDTPEVMHQFGEELRSASDADWRFLTSKSAAQIKPVLDAYQQSVVIDRGASDESRNKFSHILRVYLIDRSQQIRNIYSVSFLHPDILMNDVLTLLQQEQLSDKRQAAVSSNKPSIED